MSFSSCYKVFGLLCKYFQRLMKWSFPALGAVCLIPAKFYLDFMYLFLIHMNVGFIMEFKKNPE